MRPAYLLGWLVGMSTHAYGGVVECAEPGEWVGGVGLAIVPWLDSGYQPLEVPDFDLFASRSIVSCFGLGVRQTAYVDSVPDGVFSISTREVEAYFKTHLVASGQWDFPLGFSAGVGLLAGVRVNHVSAQHDYEAVDVEVTYRNTTVSPSLYGQLNARWWPGDWLIGLQFDLSVPLTHWRRETGWYGNRMVGIDLLVRFGPGNRSTVASKDGE